LSCYFRKYDGIEDIIVVKQAVEDKSAETEKILIELNKAESDISSAESSASIDSGMADDEASNDSVQNMAVDREAPDGKGNIGRSPIIR